jgi:rhodanese-related sulfurtransferase
MTEISPKDLKDKLDAQATLTLVDIRDAHAYQEKHIPGALNVEVGAAFVEEFKEVVPDKDAAIVLYNEFKEDETDKTSAALLESLGYKNISVLPDGLMGWMNAGFQVEFGRES